MRVRVRLPLGGVELLPVAVGVSVALGSRRPLRGVLRLVGDGNFLANGPPVPLPLPVEGRDGHPTRRLSSGLSLWRAMSAQDQKSPSR